MKKTIRDIDLTNKRIIMRVDFNVPMNGGKITDDTRIRAAMKTIQFLLDKKVKLTLCSHLGRPKGERKDEYSLKPAARHLEELLGKKVEFADDCVGSEAENASSKLEGGSVLLLENTRFHPEEKKNDADFAKQLAAHGEIYVNDAFGAAHRAHASTEGITKHLPSVMGLLMEREIKALETIISNPVHPSVAIMGGAKISDKIGVIKRLIELTDTILTGGGIANTFLKAKGIAVGKSLVDEESADTALDILKSAGENLILPEDAAVAPSPDEASKKRIVPADEIPEGWMILDVGPNTLERFREILHSAKRIVWNGPLGLFEKDAFAEGTNGMAKILAGLDAEVYIGGGDSAAAVTQAGYEDKMTHVSTGGGAFLEYLEGKQLPGIAALEDK